MAAAQMTAAASSGVLLPSFEGLRPSTINVSSVSFRMGGGLTLRSPRGLVVKAATTVAPKVNHYITLAKFYTLFIQIACCYSNFKEVPLVFEAQFRFGFRMTFYRGALAAYMLSIISFHFD